MRDDFSEPTKATLAKRVGRLCSNPKCRKLTSGPKFDSTGSVNIGVAAHITAASLGGPRFDPSLSGKERSSAENGIWLCQNCAKLIDNDQIRYTASVLRGWKSKAEDNALASIQAGKPLLDFHKPHIVAIDDNSDSLRDVSSLLRRFSDVSGFGSADEGLAFLLEHADRVNLVARLPPGVRHDATADGMFAGMWVLEGAKELIKKHQIPVILLSAGLREAIEPRVRNFNAQTHAGLVTFVSKPIFPKDLTAEVRHNLKWWHKLDC